MDDQFLNKIYQHIEDNLDNEHYSVADPGSPGRIKPVDSAQKTDKADQ